MREFYAALEGRVIIGIEATDSLHLAGFSRRTEVVIKIESVTEEMQSVELSL